MASPGMKAMKAGGIIGGVSVLFTAILTSYASLVWPAAKNVLHLPSSQRLTAWMPALGRRQPVVGPPCILPLDGLDSHIPAPLFGRGGLRPVQSDRLSGWPQDRPRKRWILTLRRPFGNGQRRARHGPLATLHWRWWDSRGVCGMASPEEVPQSSHRRVADSHSLGATTWKGSAPCTDHSAGTLLSQCRRGSNCRSLSSWDHPTPRPRRSASTTGTRDANPLGTRGRPRPAKAESRGVRLKQR